MSGHGGDNPSQMPPPPSNLLLCLMTIDVGDSRTGVLEIHYGDDPRVLASNFVRQYGLPEDEYVELLTEHVAEHQTQAQQRVLTAASGDSAQLPSDDDEAREETVSPLSEGEWHPMTPFAPAALSASYKAPSPAPPSEAEDELEAERQYAAAQKRLSVASSRGTAAQRRSSASTLSRLPSVAKLAAVPVVAAAAAKPRPHAPPHHLTLLAKPKRAASLAPVPIPSLHANAPPVDPAFWEKLHHEATEKESRRTALARQLRALERDAWREERAKFKGTTGGEAATVDVDVSVGPSSPATRTGTRLYTAGRLADARHTTNMAALRDAHEASVASAWDCYLCGAHNAPRTDFCENPSKAGVGHNKGTTAVMPVCGAPRPPRPFTPVIRLDAPSGRGRTAAPPAPGALYSAQVKAYVTERERRAAVAAAEADAAIAALPFKPAINARSAAIAKKLRGASAGPAVGARGDVVSTASDHNVALYEEGLRKKAAAEATHGTLQPWHGCSFVPDIGVNAGRHLPDATKGAFFDRLYMEGAAARARVAAMRLRMACEEEDSVAAESATAPRAATVGAPSSLLQRASAAAIRQAARVASEADRLAADVNTSYVGARSASMLSAMRKRSLAGIFRLLCWSAGLSREQREAERRAQALLEAELAEALEGDEGAQSAPQAQQQVRGAVSSRGGSAQQQLLSLPTRGAAAAAPAPRSSSSSGGGGGSRAHLQQSSAVPTAEQLARLIAAVDAHGGIGVMTQGAAPVSVSPSDDATPSAPSTAAAASGRLSQAHSSPSHPSSEGAQEPLSRVAVAALAAAPPHSRDAVVLEAALDAAALGVAGTQFLNVEAAWPDVLEPVLAGVVTEALERLKRRQGASAGGGAQHLAVSFDAFAAALGGVLEELGGGPSIYVHAARVKHADRKLQQQQQQQLLHSQSEEPQRPQQQRAAASAAVYDRIQRVSASYERRREAKDIAAIRADLARVAPGAPRGGERQQQQKQEAEGAAEAYEWYSSAEAAAAAGDDDAAARLRRQRSAELASRALMVLRATDELLASNQEIRAACGLAAAVRPPPAAHRVMASAAAAAAAAHAPFISPQRAPAMSRPEVDTTLVVDAADVGALSSSSSSSSTAFSAAVTAADVSCVSSGLSGLFDESATRNADDRVPELCNEEASCTRATQHAETTGLSDKLSDLTLAQLAARIEALGKSFVCSDGHGEAAVSVVESGGSGGLPLFGRQRQHVGL